MVGKCPGRSIIGFQRHDPVIWLYCSQYTLNSLRTSIMGLNEKGNPTRAAFFHASSPNGPIIGCGSSIIGLIPVRSCTSLAR